MCTLEGRWFTSPFLSHVCVHGSCNWPVIIPLASAEHLLGVLLGQEGSSFTGISCTCSCLSLLLRRITFLCFGRLVLRGRNLESGMFEFKFRLT